MALQALLDSAGAIYVAGVAEHVRSSITTVQTFPVASLLIFSPIWLYRITSDKKTWRFDLLIALACTEYLIHPLAWRTQLLSFGNKHATSANGYIQFIVSHWPIWLGVAFVLGLEVRRAFTPEPEPRVPDAAAARVTEEDEDFPIPPLILPARTTHTRLVPKTNSFSYSYLYVGVPVGFKGCAGSMVSADVDMLPKAQRKYGWLDVCAKDYLNRGGKHRGLEAKLRDYLRGEEVKDKDWTFAYLITAPKFLGYSFNPVSFWYVYKHDELKMMVLEVNNTFGERRMYLLKATEDEGEKTGGTRFTQTWDKDFHVSPFNSTKGTYSLQAKDPRMNKDRQIIKDALETTVDNNITLRSSKGETKLVARVFSDDEAVDPALLTSLGVVIMLMSWFWVGFLTFPRILYEATGLYFKRQLHVWFRPEVLPSTIGRQATENERIIEAAFRRYLRSLVTTSTTAVKLTYAPPGDIGETQTWSSPSASIADGRRTSKIEHVQFVVLTPYFYSRFVHYVRTSEALTAEGSCAEVKNRTVAISDPELVDLLVKAYNKGASTATDGHSRAEQLRWNMLNHLRCPPPAVSYAEDGGHDEATSVQTNDVRQPSELDVYVRSESRGKHGAACRRYRRSVCKTFAAQRYAAGFTGLVDFADAALRATLVAGAFLVAGTGELDATTKLLADGPGVLTLGGVLLAGSIVHGCDIVKG